jgi:hypothetical protein
LPEASLLETTAEVAISLAGFVGVFLVLARRDGAFSPADSFLIRVLILCCVPPMFYAVLPLLLHGFGFASSRVWTYSSSVAAAAIALISIHVLAVQARLPRGGPQLLPLWQSIFSYGSVSAALIALFINATSWFGPASGPLYAAGVWLILLVGGVTFTLLILRRVL